VVLLDGGDDGGSVNGATSKSSSELSLRIGAGASKSIIISGGFGATAMPPRRNRTGSNTVVSQS
jgi:hypothetical protein